MEHAIRIAGRRRNALHDGFKERKQILRAIAKLAVRDAIARVGVNHREIELVFGGIQVDEEVVDFIEDFFCARVGAVDLVQHDHGRELGRERFLKNIARLWQRAFAGVDQQDDAVNHAQRTLDFTAKIAVAGRVHDIDLRIMEKKRGVFRENGDAALALEVVRIHHALDERFVGAENSALAQHGVDQRRFAVVHVRDNGDIANILAHDFYVGLRTTLLGSHCKDKNSC